MINAYIYEKLLQKYVEITIYNRKDKNNSQYKRD